MIGITVILIVSWVLLFFFQKRNLLALGIVPNKNRAFPAIISFLFAVMICVAFQFVRSEINKAEWILSEGFSTEGLLNAFWWDIKSVLFEELIFRGAILFILIKRLGWKYAVILSAVAFGVYHWFSFGVFGNIMAMIIVFIGTGLMGLAWAWAYARSETILVPIALHLGWNYTFNSIFSNGPLGEIGFVLKTQDQLVEQNQFLNMMILMLAPVCMILFIKFFIKKKNLEFSTNS
ncbi:CPBP family intramembrane glutamic endopeptidase [Constantimarinum furrinae]|uniref:Peptidase n=1 Tax=Constantimarinum furrinae TaxID=2562285 RepID=A0A7G8PRD4_9FLAO|nr:type II CAAX endopeptidase family protein [Constantimarinum furrinae]QNJ96900.1 peptidase [Constantimarinum furrinae]